jgi:hypothetical protein
MAIDINGIAHIQLTVARNCGALEVWAHLCAFLNLETLIQGEDVLYCIGGRTGILVREAPADKADQVFDEDTPGLHHFCFRARSIEDVDAVGAFAADTLNATILRAASLSEQFAPGYYSVLFTDPTGIRIEVNFVPGQGHFGNTGRLGEGGPGPATRYGDFGLDD